MLEIKTLGLEWDLGYWDWDGIWDIGIGMGYGVWDGIGMGLEWDGILYKLIWVTSIDIGIMNRKSASDIVTIKCRIIVPDTQKSLVIPISIFDTGSDSSLISSAITK